jgi:pyruvate dehydrogenase E1 component alpha subunit
MHLIDFSKGNIGANAIIGAGLPIAVGAAVAFQMQRKPNVALSFFGDGATNIGTFHEALNMAAVWNAPVVFIIVNNLYGEYSPLRATTPIDDLARRADPFGFPGTIVDGQDIDAVYAATTEAVERARDGGGPTLLEMKTYRYRGHSMSDPAKYRTKEEVTKMRTEMDPIDNLKKLILENGSADEDSLKTIDRDIKNIVAEAAEFATQSPEPDPAELWTDILVEA